MADNLLCFGDDSKVKRTADHPGLVRTLRFALLLLCAATLAQGQYIETRIRTDSGPVAIVANPLDNKVYVGDNYIFRTEGAVEVIDAVSNRVLNTIRQGYWCNMVFFNPVENKAYANMQLGGLLVIDGAGDTLLGSVSVGSTINEICFDSVGNRLYLRDCGVPSTIHVLDCSVDTLLTGRIDSIGSIRGLCCNTVGRRLYVVNRTNQLFIFDADSYVVIDTIPVDDFADRFVYSPVSNKLYIASYSRGTIDVMDCSTNTIITRLQVSGPFRMMWQPVDNHIYVSRYGSSSLAVIDCARDSVLGDIDVGGPQETTCYVPTTHSVYCINGSHNVAIIDCATRSVRASLDIGERSYDLTWNPYLDRVFVACGNSNEVVVIRDEAPGVAENAAPPLSALLPTMVTAPELPLEPGTVLHDASGRTVCPSRSLAPGVYFLRAPNGVRRLVVPR